MKSKISRVKIKHSYKEEFSTVVVERDREESSASIRRYKPTADSLWRWEKLCSSGKYDIVVAPRRRAVYAYIYP